MPAKPIRPARPFASACTFSSVPIAIEAKVEEGRREVTAYAATMGVVDANGRRLLSGVFDKSIEERLPTNEIKFFLDHCENHGVCIQAEEDSTGLLTVCRVSDTQEGNDILEKMRDGSYTHYSFRAMATRYQFVMDEEPAEGGEPNWRDEIMEVSEAVLKHVGPVSEDPANRAAKILMVQAASEDFLDRIGETPAFLQALTRPNRGPLSRKEKVFARELLRVGEDVVGSIEKLRALVAPDNGTSRSHQVTPPPSTPSSAVVVVEPPVLVDVLSRVADLRKRALI